MAHPNRGSPWILVRRSIGDGVGVEHDDVSVSSNADSTLVAHLGNSLLQDSRRDQAGAPDCLVERNYFSIPHPASQNTRKTSGDARVRNSIVGKRPIILVDETARSQVRHGIGGDRRVWKQQRGLQERAIRCNVLPEIMDNHDGARPLAANAGEVVGVLHPVCGVDYKDILWTPAPPRKGLWRQKWRSDRGRSRPVRIGFRRNPYAIAL